MRYFMVASHHKLAFGLKDTLDFLTNGNKTIYEISAYTDPSISIDDQIERVFSKVNADDEVIIMSDMMGGSVTQKLYRYINEHVHVISGVNLPLALSLVLFPENKQLTGQEIERLIAEAKRQIIYVDKNHVKNSADDE